MLLSEIAEVSAATGVRIVVFHGRGGTKIDPVMEWAKENKPDWLIVFTDGCFSAPTINPKVPVIWNIHGNKGWTAPFGKVIHIEFDE